MDLTMGTSKPFRISMGIVLALIAAYFAWTYLRPYGMSTAQAQQRGS